MLLIFTNQSTNIYKNANIYRDVNMRKSDDIYI